MNRRQFLSTAVVAAAANTPKFAGTFVYTFAAGDVRAERLQRRAMLCNHREDCDCLLVAVPSKYRDWRSLGFYPAGSGPAGIRGTLAGYRPARFRLARPAQ